jgi:hypothetical protein
MDGKFVGRGRSVIKYKRLQKNIESLFPGAWAYLESRPDIVFAYLFGSFGKARPSPLSDVDVAIYLKEFTDIPGKKMEILGALMGLLQTEEVDLVILNHGAIGIRMKVLEQGKVIVDKAPTVRHQYESLTMREYFDFSVKETAILERRFLDGR